jgi:hypothetical protein
MTCMVCVARLMRTTTAALARSAAKEDKNSADINSADLADAHGKRRIATLSCLAVPADSCAPPAPRCKVNAAAKVNRQDLFLNRMTALPTDDVLSSIHRSDLVKMKRCRPSIC